MKFKILKQDLSEEMVLENFAKLAEGELKNLTPGIADGDFEGFRYISGLQETRVEGLDENGNGKAEIFFVPTSLLVKIQEVNGKNILLASSNNSKYLSSFLKSLKNFSVPPKFIVLQAKEEDNCLGISGSNDIAKTISLSGLKTKDIPEEVYSIKRLKLNILGETVSITKTSVSGDELFILQNLEEIFDRIQDQS